MGAEIGRWEARGTLAFCRAVEQGPKAHQENCTFCSNFRFKFTPALPAGNL